MRKRLYVQRDIVRRATQKATVELEMLRNLYSFPKPSINHQSIANLRHVADLKKYKDIIESLGGDGIQFFSDIIGNKGFWFFSEESPTIFEYGQNHGHSRVAVYRKLRLPEELELKLLERCIEFS